MSQTWNVPQNSQNAKALDFALVIAGWPTIYTVARSYSLPASGDLSTGNGFDATTRPWASLPDAVGASAKGRPEEGACTIAQVDIDLVDRIDAGKRSITDLCSRQSYLNDSATYPRTSLRFDIDAATDSLVVESTNGFSPTGGLIHVGGECIEYSQTSTGPLGPTLSGCVRGKRLTAAGVHSGASGANSGAGVYSFVPSIFCRRALIYKGYQDLPLSEWAPSFVGVIGGIQRQGAKVTFSLFDSMWLAYANGEQLLISSPSDGTTGVLQTVVNQMGDAPMQGVARSFDVAPFDIEDPSNVGNGHRILYLAGRWYAVTGVQP